MGLAGLSNMTFRIEVAFGRNTPDTASMEFIINITFWCWDKKLFLYIWSILITGLFFLLTPVSGKQEDFEQCCRILRDDLKVLLTLEGKLLLSSYNLFCRTEWIKIYHSIGNHFLHCFILSIVSFPDFIIPLDTFCARVVDLACQHSRKPKGSFP